MFTIQAIIENVSEAVVGLRDGTRGGSGVLVAPGVVATLARNVRSPQLTVRTADSVDRDAMVVGVDHTVDLAVLAVSDAPRAVAKWSALTPTIGQPVFALADPSGRGLRATAGAVSAEPRAVRGPSGRLVDGVIEHTAVLPRGSGGAPLLDAEGRVIGLNALRLDGGLVLAWPAAALAERSARLAAGERTAPRRLGVAVAPAGQAKRLRAAVGLQPVDGVMISAVDECSAAARAGVARGDVVVAAGGAPIDGLDALLAAVDAAGDGALALQLVRGSERLTVQLGAEGRS